MPGGKTHAPYKIVKRGTKWVVVNSLGETKATFDSAEAARAYQRALYANVPGATKQKGSLLDLRDRLMPRTMRSITDLVVDTATGVDTSKDAALTVERAFVLQNTAGHLFINGPAHVLGSRLAAQWERKANANPHYLYVAGRYVEANSPNRNNAYWTTEDLELGQPTVAGGPLNWLHDDRHIVGTITDTELVQTHAEKVAASDIGPHIAAMSTVWKFLFPAEAQVMERASDDGTLWYSMECTSEQVVCVDSPGRPGCGEAFPYAQVIREPTTVCAHLQSGTSVRRYLEPTFFGGAVIVPPVKPGWANADAKVMRHAAKVTEREGLADRMGRKDAERMVAMIIEYAEGNGR